MMAYLSQYYPRPTPTSLILFLNILLSPLKLPWWFLNTKFPHFSVYVFSVPFRTSPFPNAHINLLSLSPGHCSNVVLSITSWSPTVTLLLYKLYFLSMALITIWHNVGLIDYLFIIYFLIECKLHESWNDFWFTAWSHCLK